MWSHRGSCGRNRPDSHSYGMEATHCDEVYSHGIPEAELCCSYIFGGATPVLLLTELPAAAAAADPVVSSLVLVHIYFRKTYGSYNGLVRCCHI